MTDYLVTDTELTSVANAIRTKGGTSALLSFPTEFVSAVNAISTGIQPSGTKYIYTDIDDISEAFDVSTYEYCSVDFAPVRDGRTRYWIDIPSNDLTFEAPITRPYSFQDYTGRLDWGDGSATAEFDTSTFNSIKTHTYPAAGRYCFEVWYVSGNNSNIKFTSASTAYRDRIVAVELNVPNTSSQNFIFSSYPSLKKVVFTSDATTISVYSCTNLHEVTIPNTTTTLNAMNGNTSLEYLYVPSSVTKVTNFKDNTSMKEYHFKSTTPPTVSSGIGNNVFLNIPSNCKIYVPSASLSAYKAAQYWSTYSNYIVGE